VFPDLNKLEALLDQRMIYNRRESEKRSRPEKLKQKATIISLKC
jgi:hypothetical protein